VAQSLENQLVWCITTQDYLNDLNKELQFVAEEYQRSVNRLKSFGYLEEMLPHLESLCNEFENSIDGVVDYIESEHISYTDGRSKRIQQTILEKLGV
jgi:hypothetical protein